MIRNFKMLFLLFIFCSPLSYAHAHSIHDSNNLMQQEIKHVVILMLENRSFDNVLAWLYNHNDAPLCFIPSDADPNFLGLSEDALDQYSNSLVNSLGEVVFSCAPIKGVPSVLSSNFLNSPQFDPPEAFPHVINQIFGFNGSTWPTMAGFLQDYASIWWEHEWLDQKQNICAVMETYTDQELPVLYGLAKHYAVSDLWFSSVPTQTNPNRAFSICGTSEGQIINGPFGKSTFQADTIWNRIFEESPTTSWMIYWQADILPAFISGPFNGAKTFQSLDRIPNLENHYELMDAFHEQARNGTLPEISLIEPLWTTAINLDPKVNIVNEFFSVQALLLGLQGNDLHPPGDVRTAENMLANIYTSLIANPEAWNQTLLVITFDEHGGLFDHITPPAAISPDTNFQNKFKFDRYGVRVPALFISPRINKSTVIRSDNNLLPFDHTSLISTILKWKKIDKEKWDLGKRVDASPTFDSVITLSEPREDPILLPKNISMPKTDSSQAVSMGEAFYLKDKNGNYLTASKSSFKNFARFGPINERVPLEFSGGTGTITHGSFILIKSNESDLGDDNFLENMISYCDCFYEKNKRTMGQWWTIKSVDHPFVGSEIHYGDRVYLENHVYLDPFQYVPGRLSLRESLFGEFLVTRAITDDASLESYWIIEKY